MDGPGATVRPYGPPPGGVMTRYALVALALLASAPHLSAQTASRHATAAKPTIVLVHGAWADASGWYDVTRALQARGYKVVAGQKPLFSPSQNIHNTKHALRAPQGAVPLGGRSSGGA